MMLNATFNNISVISANTAASPIGQALILIIMYVETFKTDVIVYICNVIMRLMSHRAIIFSIRVSSLMLTISLGKIKGKKSKLLINIHVMYQYTSNKTPYRFLV